MNTDTPETDKVWRHPASFDGSEKVVHISVAQQLERERDEAREETPWGANNETKESWFERQREKFQYLEAELEKTRRERDEALRKCANLEEIIRGEWPEDQAEELIRHAKEGAK